LLRLGEAVTIVLLIWIAVVASYFIGKTFGLTGVAIMAVVILLALAWYLLRTSRMPTPQQKPFYPEAKPATSDWESDMERDRRNPR
jgi:hypothetical protein